MSSIIPGYTYDIFISYRQKDNKGDRWVSNFVEDLKIEIESTFKEEVSIYFDINPHDGLLETHDVDASLKEKLKCLVFIPILSRTYCDPKSFAWNNEFKAFIVQASQDHYGLKISLSNGNVANRVLPVRIHELDNSDIRLCESELGCALRGIDFVFKSAGINRPLRINEDHPQDNVNKIYYRDQINKIANAINEIICSLRKIEIFPKERNWSFKPEIDQKENIFSKKDRLEDQDIQVQTQAKAISRKKNKEWLYQYGSHTIKKTKKYIPAFLFIALMVLLAFGWRGHLSFLGIGKSKRDLAKSYVAEAVKYFDNKEYESSKAAVARALASDPKYSYAWSTLAAVSVKTGDVNNAILQTIEAVKYDPTNVTAAYNMAIALDDRKDYIQATEWYAKAIKIDSSFVPAYSALGRLYNLLNRPVDAILIMNYAAEKYPGSQYIYLIYKNIGNSHLMMNQLDAAIQDLEKSRELMRTEPETNLYLAKAYETSGKISRSIELWQSYIDTETDTSKIAEAKKHLKEITIKHLQEIIK
jgi:tetratricopeptide (TPR) repeat protein